MAAPSVTLIGGLRAFDHIVIVGGETVLTLALYTEGDASHLTYCPSGESIFGGHAVKSPSLVDRSLPYGSLSRSLAPGDRVFFLHCPGSSEDEAVATGPETSALQSALLVANRPPRTLQDRFMDGGVVLTFQAPDTTLDTSIPFLYKWTTLLLGRCSRILRDVGVYYGLWASIFQYSCNVSVVRAFIDAWSAETNTLVTCQGELSITLLDMDRIFGLPISGHFYDEVSPTVADFTDVRSSALPYSCHCLFLACHHLCQSLESNVLFTTAWVEFWFRMEDDAVPVHDPWTAWYARYGKGAATPRERTNTERKVFDFLHVTPGKEDKVHLTALLLVWLSRSVFRSTADDLRSWSLRWQVIWPPGSALPWLVPLWLAFIKVWDRQLLDGRRLLIGLTCIPGWQSTFTLMGRILKEPVVQQNRLEPAPTISAAENSEEEEDYDNDRSHPRRRRRSKGKKPVGVSLANKKRAPLAALNDTSVKKKPRKEAPPVSFPPSPPTFLPPIPEIEPHSKLQTSCPPKTTPPIETVQILSSPEAPEASQEEVSSPGAIAQTDSSVVAAPEGTEVVEDLVDVTPALTQPEALPVQEVAPSVVQEAAEEEVVVEILQERAPTVEEEAPAVVVQEETPAPTEEAVEVLQERAPTVEEEAPAAVVHEETLAPAFREEVPAVETPVSAVEIQDTTTPLTLSTPSASTSLTPSQQLLSHVEGLMLQVWKDRIAPRMLSPDAVRDASLLADAGFVISRLQEVSHDVTRLQVYTQKLQVLSEIENSAGEKASCTSRDQAESDARETLGILSSKLEDAEITLSEVDEELSKAKVDEEDAREREEDARERLELAREQLQSAETKVVYLTTQAE
ncbi:hypothetical protein H6P81_018479 [Aristolochia fimbriata]|uniref:Aminotransferase-like plant mobile domain-containing protein n=1 Tax=Aristolochia fimbriata TaxID=158543 RepID=A0AAV7E172_ARIFI|nr:hypothetical protein H6P81_018479 [Aristolochia fimbriata]